MTAENSGREPESTLYKRIGGYDVIAAVIDDLLARMHGDPRFARFGMGRSTDSQQRIRQLLVDQMCSLAGGPCFYTGRDMKTAHEGLAITAVEWDANMQYTDAALRKCGIGDAERVEFLSLFTCYRAHIVQSTGEASR